MPLANARRQKHEAEVLRWSTAAIKKAMSDRKHSARDRMASIAALAEYTGLLLERKAM